MTATDGPRIRPTAGTNLQVTPTCPIGTQPISGSYNFTFTNNADYARVVLVAFRRDAPNNRWLIVARVHTNLSGDLTLGGSVICVPTSP